MIGSTLRHLAQRGRVALLEAIGGRESPLYALAIERSGLAARYYDEDWGCTPEDLDRIDDAMIRIWLTRHRPIGDARKKIDRESGPERSRQLKVGAVVIDWPLRLPRLVPWSGNQVLSAIFWARADLVLDDDARAIIDSTGTVSSVSGLDESHATINTRDLGFSPTTIKRFSCLAGEEMLAIFALGLVPVVTWPDGRFALLDSPDVQFRKVARQGYYGAIVRAS